MHVRRATRDDLGQIGTVASRAMMEDELSLWLSPEQAQYPARHRYRCVRTSIRRWNNGLIMLVAVTDENDAEWDGRPKVIGYAAYEKEVGAEDDSSRVKATWSGALERFLYNLEFNYAWYFQNNNGTRKDRWEECGRVIADNEALKNYRRYWELDFLAVDPDFGRRGIGSALIDWGFERAFQDEVPMLLWASRKGYPLYKRKGFQEIGSMTFGGTVDAQVMAWTPPAKAA